MGEKDELDVSIGGEITSKHLLALISELNIVKESEAERKLQVGIDLIREWRMELQKEGLVSAEDYLSDPPMMLTKAGLKKVRELKKDWVAQGQEENKVSDAAQSLKPKIGQLPKISVLSPEKFKEVGLDVIIVASTLFSLYLLKLFFQNPNVEIMSFLIGTLILAMVVVFYQQYKKALKSREFIGFFKWLVEQVRKNRDHLIVFFILVLMVYSVGMIFLTPQRAGLYVVLSVVVATTGLVVFAPRKTLLGVVKFYVGVIFLVGGLLLFVGILSLTEMLAGSKIRLLDMALGLCLLFLVHMNEKELGLNSLNRKK